MNRLTVAHVTTVDVSLRYLLLNQMQAIQKAGFEVVGLSAPGPDVPAIEGNKIRHLAVPFVRASNLTPLADLRAFWNLVRILRRERFTIVHTHTAKADLYATMAARLARVPVVVTTLHGFYFHENMTPFWRRFFAVLAGIGGRFADVVLSQNPEDMETNRQERIYAPGKMKLLGNGIDIDWFDRRRLSQSALQQKRLELGLPSTGPVVGFVGRLVRDKGILELLQAARLVAKAIPSVKFLLVGPEDPAKTDALAADVAHDYGVADLCTFAGHRLDMPEMYASMDIFVLPSHREAFPRSIMEASAMMLPVVATDVRGCRTAVEANRNGLIVPLGDVPALAEAIIELLHDPLTAERMGQQGREVAEARFDERIVFRKVLEEYDCLLAAKGISRPESGCE